MGPLEGVRIVEFAGLGPAPFGPMMLADLGAEIIRVDRPGGYPAPERRGGRDGGGTVTLTRHEWTFAIAAIRAFSSEVEIGSRQENASNQESRAPLRFHRSGKGSSADFQDVATQLPY
jgi:hypothetical protein